MPRYACRMIRRATCLLRPHVASARLTAVLAAAVLVYSLASTHAAGTRHAPTPATLDLQPMRHADLDNLEIEFADVRQTRPSRRGITDLLVVLLPGRTPLDRALASAGGVGVATERRLFRAQVTAVSGGRLYRAPIAWCGSFGDHLSVCELDCDGGRFSLRRGGSAAARFALIVGPGAGDVDSGAAASGGLTLSACSLEATGESRLVARNGAVADIALGHD